MTHATTRDLPDDNGPRYAQVAQELRAAILSGEFADGDQIPTETVLCARYGISRFTVREALRRLQADGLIRRRRGSGTIVDRGGHSLRQPLSDVQDLLQYAAGSEFSFVPQGLITLGAPLAREIGRQPGESWLHITGLRRMGPGGAPIAATDVYVHRDLAALVPQLVPSHETLFSQIERLAGLHIARVEQDIQAVAASIHTADLLGVVRRSPCLRILRSYIDGDGRTVEISSSIHPGDRFTYSMHIDN